MLLWMGMHLGFIAAECEWTALHASLEKRCGPLTDTGEISAADWFDTPAGQDVFHVASQDGRTYLLDPGLVLSADSDLIVGLGHDLSCLIVGAGGETVSGSFWFTAADAGGLRRLHFDVSATLTEPFNLGSPLPSEADVRWDDIDGAGIIARVGDLGFNTDILSSGPLHGGHNVVWEGGQIPPPGSLSAQINEHCGRYRRADADDWTRKITVQTRDGAGFDIQAQRSDPTRQSRFRRLFKRGA